MIYPLGFSRGGISSFFFPKKQTQTCFLLEQRLNEEGLENSLTQEFRSSTELPGLGRAGREQPQA